MWLLAAGVVLVTLGVAVRLYLQYGRPDHDPRVLAVSHKQDESVTVRFEVRQRDAKPGVCRVRARAVDGSTVGSADVRTPAGSTVDVTFTLTTSQRAAAVDVPACRRASTGS